MNQTYLLQQMQLQRVIGELGVLKAAYYDPMGNNITFGVREQIINKIIEELENELG